MYNKLFDVLYSDRLTEDVKLLVLEKLDLDLNEGADELSPYVSYINTLINTNITSEALEEVLDMTFSGLSEEEIDKITEEFIRASVEAYIAEAAAPIGLVGVRKEAARREAAAVNKPKADRPIGLAGVRKAAAQAEAPKAAPKNNEFKGPSAMDRLKSAVGKVKKFASNVASKAKEAAGKAGDWAKKTFADNKPTGLSKLQSEKEARIAEAVKMGTGPDTTPKKEVETKAPKPKASSKPKEEKVKQTKLNFEQPVETTAETPKEAPKPKTPRKRATGTKKSTTGKLNASAKKVAKDEQTDTKPETPSKNKPKGKRKPKTPKSTNEALAEVICLLADTNISESILEFVIDTVNEGKVFNEQNRVKVVEKKKGAYEEALKKLDQAVEKGARTHTDQVTPAMVDKVSHAGLSYETAKTNTEHKYGHKID